MKYPLITAVGFLIWFFGTWHGGFSDKPQSILESCTDIIGIWMIFWGIFGDIAQSIVYKKENHITTEKVVFQKCDKDCCLD